MCSRFVAGKFAGAADEKWAAAVCSRVVAGKCAGAAD